MKITIELNEDSQIATFISRTFEEDSTSVRLSDVIGVIESAKVRLYLENSGLLDTAKVEETDNNETHDQR